jgi:hypothetical protein
MFITPDVHRGFAVDVRAPAFRHDIHQRRNIRHFSARWSTIRRMLPDEETL